MADPKSDVGRKRSAPTQMGYALGPKDRPSEDDEKTDPNVHVAADPPGVPPPKGNAGDAEYGTAPVRQRPPMPQKPQSTQLAGPPPVPAASPPPAPSPTGPLATLQAGPQSGPIPAANGRIPVTPHVEVVFADEAESSPAHRWRVVEIWTRNRVYMLDASLTCLEVINRSTGKPEPHQFVGARLGGGQRREGNTLKLSHPLPVPGTDAVFKLPNSRRGPFGQTSQVERVVYRLRLASVSLLQAEPAWEEITENHYRPKT